MREILFKGKYTLNGEWVQGCLLHDAEQNESYIAECFEDKSAYIREVDPETVGQYTGLTDKNGTKIFEGDVVKFSYNENDKYPEFYSIEWKKDRACFGYAETGDKMIEVDSLHCEVIGNIHD